MVIIIIIVIIAIIATAAVAEGDNNNTKMSGVALNVFPIVFPSEVYLYRPEARF